MTHGRAEEGTKTSARTPLQTAQQILEELRFLDAAIDQWAIENHKPDGTEVSPLECRVFIKKGTRLYTTLGDPTGPKDMLGNPLGPIPFIVGKVPMVSPKTFQTLSDVTARDFWKPYLAGED